MKRSLLLAAMAAILVASTATAQKLRVGAQNMPPYLDPGKDHTNVGSQFYTSVFDTLIGKDPTSQGNVFVPGLAVSWKLVSPTVMELKLRQGVKFQNGDPLTADDVVFSLMRSLDPSYAPYKRLRDRLGNFTLAEKVDDETVRIHAARPEPLWETLLSMQQAMIVPKNYIMGLSGDPNAAEVSDYDAFGLAPVGTGPYKVARLVPGDVVELARFDEFWGEKAPYEKVTLRGIPEMASRITALRNDEVDLITNIPPDQVATVESDPSLKVEGETTAVFHLVIYNTQNPVMRDKRLRQALNLAIDRDTLNQALWQGKGAVPSTYTLPQFGDLYTPELKTFAYDPERAKELVKESGYDGTEIVYDTPSTYYTNGLLAAQAIREMWAAVGVKMSVNVLERWNGADPAMMARNWSNPMYFADPAGMFGAMWAPGAASEVEGRFKPDDEYKALWESFRFSTGLAERKAAYAKLMERIADDPPFLLLYQPYEAYAMKKTLNWKPLPGHVPYVLDFRAGHIGGASD
jgi:peptide/nickel transport system substrate-binding protein